MSTSASDTAEAATAGTSRLAGRLRALVVAGEPSAAISYAGATLVLVMTAAVQLSLFSASAPWFLYTPAVVIVTLAFGAGPGVWGTALAAIAAGYVVVGPEHPLLMKPVHWTASLIFTLTTLGLVALVRALKIALRDADAVRAARDRDLAESVEREAFLSSVLSASTDCIKVIELDGSLSFMNDGGLRIMEISEFNDVRGCQWPDLLKGDGSDLARKAIEAAKEGHASHFEAGTDTFSGTPKQWSVSVSPIQSPSGPVSRVLAVSRDYTALAEAREQQQLLNGELAHRLKNTLSVVQAIAHQTLGRSGDGEALAEFSERLTALSKAHDVLTAQSWSAANMGDVMSSVLSMFDEGGSIVLSGPQLGLGSRATLSISLLLHELATNAVKYGALSVPGGRVELSWEVVGADNDQAVQMVWAERGGPPAVKPNRRGFGSRIIQMGLTGSGGTEVHYGKEGLTVKLFATLPQLEQA